MEEDSSLVLILEVQFKGTTETILIPYTDWDLIKAGDVRNYIREHFEWPSEEDNWIIFKGRRLLDCELISHLGIENYSRVYFGVKQSGSSKEKDGIIKEFASPPSPPKMPSFMADMLASNPEIMIEMLQTNPKFKSLIQRHPHIKHALSDPQTMKSLIKMSTDPKAMREVMLDHDRALSNIENIPGGFQALQQLYTKEMVGMENDFNDLFISKSVKSSNDLDPETVESEKGINREPMPNPWRKQKYSSQMELLRSLGFDNSRENMEILLLVDGDVQRAVERLEAKRQTKDKN